MIEITKRFKALSDPIRVRILRLLNKEELNVQELMFILNMSQSRISHHLSILKDSEFISDRHEGTFVYYKSIFLDNDNKLLYQLIDEKAKAQLSKKIKEKETDKESISSDLTWWQKDFSRLEICLKKRTDKSRMFFKTVAKRWDEIRKNLYDETIALKAINRIIPDEYVVIDLGTGTGFLLPYLSEIATKVVGIDNSREMLKIAKNNLKTLKIKNVRLKYGCIEKLPVENNFYNAAFANMVLHHSAKPILAIKEIHRILKKNGKVVIIDLLKHNVDEMREKMGDLWLGFDTNEIRNWLNEAGFRNVKYTIYRSKKIKQKTRIPTFDIFVTDGIKM